jgi:hypothetical protein
MNKISSGAAFFYHCRYNFYPPFTEKQTEALYDWFKDYWNGKLSYDELIKNCDFDEIDIERFSDFIFVNGDDDVDDNEYTEVYEFQPKIDQWLT